jgi:hypothetical protein
MRKLLYTTTALIGAAFLVQAAPAKAEVSLAARYNANMQFGDKMKDDPNDRGNRFADGARVDFSASKDHPNGLTTGFFSRMTMDGDKDVAAFDDVAGSIAGAFGTVTIGSTGDAGSNVHVGGTPGTTHFGVGEGNVGGVSIGTSAVSSVTGYEQSIRYDSPSFSGFNFSASYAPETNGDRDGKDDVGEYNNAFAFGVGYSNSFAGTSVKLSAGYGTTDSKPGDYTKPGTVASFRAGDDVGGTAAASVDEDTDTIGTAVTAPGKMTDKGGSAFAFGAEVGYQDFKFGGSYGQHERGTAEVTAWRMGAAYAVDAFTFGVGYGSKETQNGAYVLNALTRSGTTVATGSIAYGANAGSKVEETSLAFTVDYALGDGANIDFGIEVDEKVTTDSSGTKTTNYDDTMFGVGVTLSF